MAMPLSKTPPKPCEQCGKLFGRKKFKAGWETPDRFAARRFCSTTCSGERKAVKNRSRQLECEHTDQPHHAEGLCKACWQEKKRVYHANWTRENVSPETLRQYARKHSLMKWYGITLAEYEEMWAKQKGRCANKNCRRKCDLVGLGKNRLCVDHDHKTGRIRGLVCHACNVALGLAKDDPAVLQGLIDYLVEN